MEERLRDIIALPEVKLVIELDDADQTPQTIVSSFVLTKEVEEGLRIILNRVEQRRGCGVFLKGNFGSGKSHFLSYLYLLLKNKDNPILEDYPNIKKGDFRVVKISLVKYPSSRSLEGIVLDAFNYRGEVANREEQFKKIVHMPVVLIIDELSEFLRSKSNPPAFYEDIRFLQFLGEFSFHNPFWICSSLQEWIEDTGHISSPIFNRIKDRYPVRISLSSSHIEDIIDQRIVIKKQAKEDIIESVFNELKGYYPNMYLKFADFRKTYPLHPFTTRYLAGLTPVFSQHRGVIQFVYSEVHKILDQSFDTLITAETIFDHFQERIREIPEYSPLVRVVYDYYKSHVHEIFLEPHQKEIALSVIKILILTEISPLEKRKTAAEIAEVLLRKISTLTSKINYEYIRGGILQPLLSHQMYIKQEEDTYFIDIAVDEGIRVKGKTKALREEFANKEYLFTQICNYFCPAYLPLKEIKESRRYRFSWQNSSRECMVLVCLHPFNQPDIKKMIEEMETKLDGIFIILSPFTEEKWVYSLKEINTSAFLSSLILWVPRSFTDEESIFVEEFIARHMLIKEFPYLKDELSRDDARFREVITEVYFGGRIIYGSGRQVENLSEIGYLPIERLLSHLFDFSLSLVHPNHHQIMQRVDYFSFGHLNSLFANFIKEGKITLEEAEKKGLTLYIKGLVEPLGLVNKKGNSFLISLDVSNELISYVLNLASQHQDITVLRVTLKKSKWGLTEAQIDLILSAFIACGHLIPYSKGQIIELKDFSQLRAGQITDLKPGKTLQPQLLAYIPYGKFIWGEVEDVPTPLTQQMMWQEATRVISTARKSLAEANKFIERYSEYTIFKKMHIDFSFLNRLSMFLHSITFSLPFSEGLEKILLYLKENPDMAGEISYLENLRLFFSEQIPTINKYYLYLTHPSIRLPRQLSDKKDALCARIEDYLVSFKGEFIGIKEAWDNFFNEFIDIYSDKHRLYYESGIFRLRESVEDSCEGKLLKRIAQIVNSVTFLWEWWDIRSELDKLPQSCPENLSYELFLNPVCKCGFIIEDNPPEVGEDFAKICKEGIRNFLKLLQLPENREKLDSYVLSLNATGTRQKEVAQKLSSLIHLDVDKANLSLVLPLLTDEVLEEIETALKGRWKTKEVSIGDFVRQVKGKRFKFSQLKELFLQWAGNDDDSIVHVKDWAESSMPLIKENFCKYGSGGEKIYKEISEKNVDSYGDANEILKEKDGEDLLKAIKYSSYSTEQLFEFLEKEKIDCIKQKLRTEIFYRLYDKFIPKDIVESTKDSVTKDLLDIIRLFSEGDKYQGVEIFTKIIASLTYLFEKISYANPDDNIVDNEVIEKIKIRLENILGKFEGSSGCYDGLRDIDFIKKQLKDTVIIFDGLRYDLWLVLRAILETEGAVIEEETFKIPPPTQTDNFRKILGIEQEQGNINSRSYRLLKWAERDVGRRRLKKFLESSEEIKFLHFNFIDTKIHNSTIDLFPLYTIIKEEFVKGIMPIIKGLKSFYLLSDHGFSDTKRLENRYTHGKDYLWETILPFAKVKFV